MLGNSVIMPERSSRTISSTIETIEWRLARQEDGPVWVALTREGRAPLLPREALTEPARRLAQDRREREEELRYFLSQLPDCSGQCYLLWHAGSALGRVCFTTRGNEAFMWGLALLPSVKSRLGESVVQSIVDRANTAGATTLTAAFEVSHLSAFKSEGFAEVRRYSTVVAATQESDEDQESQDGASKKKPARPPMPCHIREMNEQDRVLLLALKQETSSENDKHPTAEVVWSHEIAQLMGSQGYQPMRDCTFVAESYPEEEETPAFLGNIQVSQWRRIAVITDLCVARSYRRRGIGGALINQARGRLAELGYPTVIATINEKSRAQRLFRKAGFRDVQHCTIVGELELKLKDNPR
jgi:ribosomal protein S18 acetylase RimI-like enzyme